MSAVHSDGATESLAKAIGVAIFAPATASRKIVIQAFIAALRCIEQ
jgi:hypothetical protein